MLCFMLRQRYAEQKRFETIDGQHKEKNITSSDYGSKRSPFSYLLEER